ncbi:MAG: 4a-hydroxytetrahydrobiopterin dehydratase [Bacteroidia bacterium]
MWKEQNNKLSQEFKFKNFSEAFAFMTRVALVADKMDHHPDWSNSYDKVNISLSTHSEGSKVTAKDHKLADEIDKILK